MPNVKTTYSGNTVSSVLPREGLDIGPMPDFWADLEKMSGAFKRPKESPIGASRQGQALRAPAQERPAPPPRQANSYAGRTARSFGRPTMSQHGVWGNYVNPVDVPLELMGVMPTGFFADDVASNYTYSPLVNQANYHTGQTQRERPR